MPAERNLRRDAAENRDRLIKAARTVFAEQGSDAPLENIARMAKVSRATLYRNFATREELAALIFEENVACIERRAQELAGTADGIVRIVDFILDIQRDNRTLSRLLVKADLGWLDELSQRTTSALQPLLERARSQGTVHPWIDIDHLMLVFPMAAGAVAAGELSGKHQTDEMVRLMLHRTIFPESTGSD